MAVNPGKMVECVGSTPGPTSLVQLSRTEKMIWRVYCYYYLWGRTFCCQVRRDLVTLPNIYINPEYLYLLLPGCGVIWLLSTNSYG